MSFKRTSSREHKERSQPKERAKFGLLEKKKDYKLRTDARKEKVKKISELRQSVELKNPEEFRHGMTHTKKFKQGKKHVLVSTKEIDETSKDYIRIFTDETAANVNLVNYRQSVANKNIEKLKNNLNFIGVDEKKSSKKVNHVVFVDDESEVKEFQPEEYFETPKEFLKRSFNRPKTEDLEKGPLVLNRNSISAENLEQMNQKKASLYKELAKNIKKKKKYDTTRERIQLEQYLRTTLKGEDEEKFHKSTKHRKLTHRSR